MGMITILERSGEGDVQRFDEAMKRAKSGLMEACEIWEDMKSQFSERDHSYSTRYSRRGDYGERYGERDGERDGEEMSERRYRDSMGRYR